MTFVHPLLLGGLLLAGIPILLHLIMRQKPKRLPFPAFRFLLDRVRMNQRKLRLRHLLLLALRIMLVALICLALARPKLLTEGIINIAGNQPVAVALVFDTSMSMEYQSGQKSRLAEAQQRALELLDELPAASRVAVFDTADPASGDWIDNLPFARERIAALQLRPEGGSVTGSLAQAYRLLADLDEEPSQQPWPRFLYIFSDRTPASWDAGQLPHLTELRDRLLQKAKAPGLYIDVGMDQPEDLAIVQARLDRQVVPANTPARLHALVRATGREFTGEIVCRIAGKSIGRQPLKLAAGPGQEFTFEARDLKPGVHHAEIVLEPGDNLLPYDNARFASFGVVGPRKVLLIADKHDDTLLLKAALEKLASPFQCTEMLTDRAKELEPSQLADYQAICLISVSNPSVFLWELLARYVRAGGGLAIIPGGAELRVNDYQTDEAKRVMPASFKPPPRKPDQPVRWDETTFQSHPLMAVYKDWAQKSFSEQVEREARMYWEVEALPGGDVLASYQDGKPALVERRLDRGKVLLLTTPMDLRASAASNQSWSNYLQSWYYLALADLTVSYLAGTLEDRTLNHACGQPVLLALPATPRFATYTLTGPGLVGQATQVPRPENAAELRMPPQAVLPGSYTLTGGDGQW
jgi:hypothetical protein